MDLLSPSSTLSRCPYKGTAEWYSVTVEHKCYPDFAWWYRHPVHETAPIAALVAFYNEKVDLFVDGLRHERPVTQWS
jgi:uncharacterized protein (DUF427 family)